MNIHINYNDHILNNSQEQYIIKHLHLRPYTSYSRISQSKLNKIKQKYFLKFNRHMTDNIILSIKSAFMKEHIIKNFYKLNKHKNSIVDDYLKYKNKSIKKNILLLSTKYDLSPMTMMNHIIFNIYNTYIKNIKNNINIDIYDYQQIDIAKNNDIYFQLDQTTSIEESKLFEKNIETILIKKNIKYKTQEQLTIEQKKSIGKPINTPDFLILSDLIINNVKINWIDAKNFFGSNNKFIRSKILKQTKKYLASYGSGMILFSLGFNSDLQFKDILLMNYESVHDFIYS